MPLVKLRSFFAARAGSTAVWFALAVPLLAGATGVAINYAWLTAQRGSLQSIADNAATNAARELTFARPDPNRVAALAVDYAKKLLQDKAPTAVPTAQVIDNNTAVTVQISYQAPLPVPINGQSADIGATATARITGSAPICVVVLEDKAGNALYMQKYARMTGEGCAIYSDSRSPTGIKGQDASKLTAALICSAGGYSGSGNFNPTPVTDCPPINDPLAARQAPPDAPCTFNTKTLDTGGVLPLTPGVYCGGLTITKNTTASLSPGVYVIKDGPLKVSGGGTIQGNNVGFYLKGNASVIDFSTDSTVSLTAPKDGLLSGILFFEDRAAQAQREHKILSDNARTLLGTIYLSQGTLLVDANKPVSDKSAYTIIVARRMKLDDGPNLYLNTGYDKTDIPVPQGVGPYGSSIYLTR